MQQPLVEALTSREQEILDLMAADQSLTQAEIGERLYIATNTVKDYFQLIYDKLGLVDSERNKKTMLARARALRLLSTTSSLFPTHNLPAQTTEFIGREQELLTLSQFLRNLKVRLITILAPGGMGKSRLALELGARALGDFTNGVFFAPLAPLRDPEHIVNAIAESTGFQFMSDQREPKQQILDFLSNKNMLLILDNFEHLLEGASLVTDILKAAPDVQVIVTSREKLSLRGEKTYTVSGMEFPDWETPEDALQYDAVKLFLQGAQLAATDFELVADDLKFLARICRLVEGMPLAIVLAAAWVEVLSFQEIADEISQSIDFLAAEMRDVPRRQWSIRAVFEPTWNRMNENEQAAFMRFSVFRGGATRKATQYVTGADLKTLQALVNKSLIERSTEHNPAGRYAMHELLRQYAETKLDESGDADLTRNTHSEYYLNALAEREEDIKGRDQIGTLNDIESDFENVKAAWYWAVERKKTDLLDRAMDCLDLFCEYRSHSQEAIALFNQAQKGYSPQQGDDPHLIWRRVLLRRCWPERWLYGSPYPIAQIESCLKIARKRSEMAEVAYCLLILSRAIGEKGNHMEAITLLEESLAHYRAVDDKFHTATVLLRMSGQYAWAFDLDSFAKYAHQSLEMAREIDHKRCEANNLHNLSVFACFDGNYREAEQGFQDALTLSRELGLWYQIAYETKDLSGLAFSKGDLETARALLNEALTISKATGFILPGRESIGVGLEIVAENYAEARLRCEASREYSTQFSKSELLMQNDMDVSLIDCGLEAYMSARQHMQSALKSAIKWHAINIMTDSLPAAAIIEANTGNKTHAVELLALAFCHPKSATGWMEKWPLLTRLRESLLNDLGEEAFNAAWERGKVLDLETVVQQLLVGFEPE
jgi:predicted ATPase/DNA-binding CsgD family transcriptional regulator